MRHTACGLGARSRAWVWMWLGLTLLATLAPAVSRTLAHGTTLAERGWVEVCSAHGMAWVRAEGAMPNLGRTASPPPPPASWLRQLDACGLCTLGIDRGTPPPEFDGWGLSLPLPLALPAVAGLGHGTPLRVAAWARGPPDHL